MWYWLCIYIVTTVFVIVINITSYINTSSRRIFTYHHVVLLHIITSYFYISSRRIFAYHHIVFYISSRRTFTYHHVVFLHIITSYFYISSHRIFTCHHVVLLHYQVHCVIEFRPLLRVTYSKVESHHYF